MATNHVVVFKDKRSREIKTYVNLTGHGAQMSAEDFIKLVAERFGNPALTFTNKSLTEGLLTASAEAIRHMKAQTLEVAAMTIEPKRSGP